MNIEEVKTYPQLVEYLEKWKSFADDQVYDWNGMVGLLSACLRNMKQFYLESDFEELPETELIDELETIEKIFKHLKDNLK